MINLVKIISNEVQSLLRMVKFYRLGNKDIQTAAQAGPYGTDSNPIKNMVGVYAQTGVKGDTVLIGYLNKSCLADPGEHRIFSTDADGTLKTYIWLTNNGIIELGGDSGNPVRFQELKTAFDELNDKFNNLVTVFNAHVHPGVTTGGGSTTPTVTQATASTADMTAAKINEIKTP